MGTTSTPTAHAHVCILDILNGYNNNTAHVTWIISVSQEWGSQCIKNYHIYNPAIHVRVKKRSDAPIIPDGLSAACDHNQLLKRIYYSHMCSLGYVFGVCWLIGAGPRCPGKAMTPLSVRPRTWVISGVIRIWLAHAKLQDWRLTLKKRSSPSLLRHQPSQLHHPHILMLGSDHGHLTSSLPCTWFFLPGRTTSQARGQHSKVDGTGCWVRLC